MVIRGYCSRGKPVCPKADRRQWPGWTIYAAALLLPRLALTRGDWCRLRLGCGLEVDLAVPGLDRLAGVVGVGHDAVGEQPAGLLLERAAVVGRARRATASARRRRRPRRSRPPPSACGACAGSRSPCRPAPCWTRCTSAWRTASRARTACARHTAPPGPPRQLRLVSPSNASTMRAGASSLRALLLSAPATSRLTFQLQLAIGRSARLNAAVRCRPEAEPSATRVQHRSCRPPAPAGSASASSCRRS